MSPKQKPAWDALGVMFPLNLCTQCRYGYMDWNNAALLVCIIGTADTDGVCRLTNAMLTDQYGKVSVSTTKRRVQWLVDHGWVWMRMVQTVHGTRHEILPDYERIGEAR